jgi:hypothetical protein
VQIKPSGLDPRLTEHRSISPYWIYGEAVTLKGGREAWVVGGGDDLRITYANPVGPRR